MGGWYLSKDFEDFEEFSHVRHGSNLLEAQGASSVVSVAGRFQDCARRMPEDTLYAMLNMDQGCRAISKEPI